MEYLRNSKLTKEDTELIWDSVDIGNKEALTREEFQMMLRLIKRRQQGMKIGPETVSDWRLEQLKSRRKQQGISKTSSPQRHGTIMMKELQPILDQRAHQLEEHFKNKKDSSRRNEVERSMPSSYDKKDDDDTNDHDHHDLKEDTKELMLMTKNIDWKLLSIKKLEIMIEKFERLLETYKLTEERLDKTLIEQRKELKLCEKQQTMSSKSSSSPNQTTTKQSQMSLRKEFFEKEIKRIGHELEQFYTSHHMNV